MNWPLFFSILIFYAILVGVNIPAPFLGLEFEDDTKPRLWYQPPGYIISVAWFVLFTLLGIARYHLIQGGHSGAQGWLFALAVLCASYAYYTLGFAKLTNISALWYGLVGNIVVILFTGIVVLKLLPFSRTAAFLTIPVIIWTAFASLIIIGEMRLQKLL